MKSCEGLIPKSTRGNVEAKTIEKVLKAAIDAVDPHRAILNHIRLESGRMLVAGLSIDLHTVGRLIVIGAGKASVAMALGLVDVLGDRINSGLIITKVVNEEICKSLGPIQVERGSHPVPDQASVQATLHLMDQLTGLTQNDLVLCLISGGGSALMTNPVEGVSLEDLRKLTSELLASGATIQEINTLRKHLDRIKGGGLARAAYPARVISLILSDVIGNPLDVIASGPTVADPTTYQDGIDILRRYGLWGKCPVTIRQFLQKGARGEIEETIKLENRILERVDNILIGSNYLAARAALNKAAEIGFHTLLLTTSLQGEASQAGKFLAAIARQISETGDPVHRPACILAGGETTVTLRGEGQGGRNQEVALGAVEMMSGLKNAWFVSLATDGEDGPTDAAGAIVTGSTEQMAQQRGLSAADFLARNDSYAFFHQLDALVCPGPTGTNVNDLNFLFLF